MYLSLEFRVEDTWKPVAPVPVTMEREFEAEAHVLLSESSLTLSVELKNPFWVLEATKGVVLALFPINAGILTGVPRPATVVARLTRLAERELSEAVLAFRLSVSVRNPSGVSIVLGVTNMLPEAMPIPEPIFRFWNPDEQSFPMNTGRELLPGL